MPCSKALKPRPVPLARRLSAAFHTERFGAISGVLDVLDYGRGTPCTSGHAFLRLADGSPFYDGSVSLLNGGVVIESLKRNGRPAKTNRDVGVHLATEFFIEKRLRDAPDRKPLRKEAYSDVYELWKGKTYPSIPDVDAPKALNSRGKKEIDKADPFGRMSYITHDGLDGVFVHMQKGCRVETWPCNEIVVSGPCWVWRYGDENAAFYPASQEAARLCLKNDVDAQDIVSQLRPNAAESANTSDTVCT